MADSLRKRNKLHDVSLEEENELVSAEETKLHSKDPDELVRSIF